MYLEVEEIIPSDMLEPLSKECTNTCYLDADHARVKETCRSVTGILLLYPVQVNKRAGLHVISRAQETTCLLCAKQEMTMAHQKKSFFRNFSANTRFQKMHLHRLKQAENACFNHCKRIF